MRILHVDTGREMRGGQLQVLLLVRGLRDRGHACKLLARGRLLEAAREEGIDVEEAAVLTVLSRRSWGELVHAHDARAHTLCVLAAARPLVVARRVAFPVRPGFLSRFKYSRAERYIAVSNHVAALLQQAGVRPERVRVVHDAAPGFPVKPPDGRIVAVHTDDPRKGTAVVRATGLPVVFSSNLDADLPGASVFLYISEEEGLGSAALAAMSAGVPVVASRVGGLPEVVEHEETGLLVENTPQAVRAAVERILGDRGLAERLGRAGRRRFEERFTIDGMIAGTLEVYRECL